jgi:hypothetical protein
VGGECQCPLSREPYAREDRRRACRGDLPRTKLRHPQDRHRRWRHRRRRRDAALAGLGRVPTTLKTLAAAETLAAVLRAGGLSDRVVALGLDQLVLHVSATALEESIYQQRDMTPNELAQYFADVRGF